MCHALHRTLRTRLLLKVGVILLIFQIKRLRCIELICPRSPSWDSNPGLPAAKGCGLNQHNTLPKNCGPSTGDLELSLLTSPCPRGVMDTPDHPQQDREAEFRALGGWELGVSC